LFAQFATSGLTRHATLASTTASSPTDAAEIFAKHGFCVLPPGLVGIDDAKLDALHEGERFCFGWVG
jgi:hypothetical protein